MFTRIQTSAIENACLDAERLYNTLVQWYADDDYSDEHSKQLVRLNKIYIETLEFIRSFGIGAVLINKVFRDTNTNERKGS